MYLSPDPIPECCSIFHTTHVYGALTGLLFCVGGHQLIISSHVSFDLLLFASLFVAKSVIVNWSGIRNYQLEILGH